MPNIVKHDISNNNIKKVGAPKKLKQVLANRKKFK